jgi:Sap, sulfolipid-1-addressing protein
VVPFVLLTLLLLALPSLLVTALGERAQTFLPKVRDWMNSHSWLISEIVLALFIIIVASGMSESPEQWRTCDAGFGRRIKSRACTDDTTGSA